MTRVVQEAVYRMSFEGAEKAAAAGRALDGVAVSEEKLTRATRTRADAVDRLLGRLDPRIRAEQQLQRTLEQLNRAEQQGIGTAQQRAQAAALATQRYNESVQKLGSSHQTLARSTGASTAATNSFTGAAGRANSAVSGLATRLIAIGGAALGTRQLISYSDAWTVAGNKIAAAGEVAGRAGRGLRDINNIATETRSDLTATADLYAKLLRATGDVAKSEAEVASATEIVAKAFKAGGAAASEQAAGILQLSQALSSGLLQGDELRSLRENAPLVAQAIADEFQTTIGGLKQLGADGALTVDRVFKAILNAAPQIEKAFGRTNSTIAEGFTLIGNAATELIGTTGEATGASSKFTQELTKLATAIRDPGTIQAAQNLGASLAGMFSAAIPAIESFVNRDLPRLKAEVATTWDFFKSLRSPLENAQFLDPERFLAPAKQAATELLRAQLMNADAMKQLGAESDEFYSHFGPNFRKAAQDANAVANAINNIPANKTVNITTVHTVRSIGGGTTNIGVTRLSGVAPDTNATHVPGGSYIPGTIGGLANAPQGKASGGPVSAGSTYLVGEQGPELVTMAGSGNVSTASATASILSGGSNVLRSIEENTFLTVEEVRRATSYLETISTDVAATIGALDNIRSALRSGVAGSSSVGTTSSSGSRFGSFSGGSSASSGSGGHSFSDPSSPYYWRPSLYANIPYSPLADFTLNGNRAALMAIAGTPKGMYESWGGPGPGGVMNAPAGYNPNLAAARSLGGFDSGGYIAPGDTQRVQFFKRPDEAVAVLRPEQRAAVGEAMTASKTVNMGGITINVSAPNGSISPRSMLELRDGIRRAVQSAAGDL